MKQQQVKHFLCNSYYRLKSNQAIVSSLRTEKNNLENIRNQLPSRGSGLEYIVQHAQGDEAVRQVELMTRELEQFKTKFDKAQKQGRG